MIAILLAAGTLLGHGVAPDSGWTFEGGGGLVGGFVRAAQPIGARSEVSYMLDLRLDSDGRSGGCGVPGALYGGAWVTWAASSGPGPLQVTVRGGPGLQVNAGRAPGRFNHLGVPAGCALEDISPTGTVADADAALMGRIDFAFGGDHVRIGPFGEATVREAFPFRQEVGFDLMAGLRAAGGGQSLAVAAEAGLGATGFGNSGGFLPRLMLTVSFR